jgi:glycosyltransferase involved in cell wall biosynthesis
MHVTVAIGTWNRADLLDAALTSLAKATIPAGVTWDVIVVNNNSTDHTEEVLDKHLGRLPLTRLHVPRQGRSHALNAAIERLTGDLVLWTDDDVEVAENWIASYVDAACRWPDAAFFGGRIVPRFPGGEPGWLRPAWRTLAEVYAERELGDEPFAIDRKRLPFGANLAVRVAVQKRYPFDPELGRRGALLLAGEETALLQQWLSEGRVGMWVPQSRVDHIVTPDRAELDYIRRFFFSLAESQLRGSRADWPLVRLFRGGWYACRAMKYEVLSLLYPQATQPDRWMQCLKRSSYGWGRVESQWGDFPRWLKPAPLRRLEQRREQPRPAAPSALPAAAGLGDATASSPAPRGSANPEFVI